MEPSDGFLDGLILSFFPERKKDGGYIRTCPKCGKRLILDGDGVWSCPDGHYRHP